MTVSYSSRTLPLAKNASNTLASAIVLGYDFTGVDSAHMNGVPWIYQGSTVPTLATTGTQTASTVNGEPGRIPAVSSYYDYTNTTDYGLQVGNGDFTIAIRLNMPATLPTTGNSREILRIANGATTAITVAFVENPNVGWYLTASGSTAITLGSTQTAVFYAANTSVMVFITRVAGVTTIYTQNATAQTNAVVRYAAGAAATAPLNSTNASRLMLNYGGASTTTFAMSAFAFWNVGLSQADVSTVGKDFYNLQANGAVADSLAITSPVSGATISTTSTISGTYVGTQPTGIEVQVGSGSWVAGTGMTIGGGNWSGTFVLPAGAASTLTAREANNTAVVSPAVSNVTVQAPASSITFTAPSKQQSVVPYRIFQGNSSDQVMVRISGTYIGSPSALEWRWNGGAWATLVASPSAGAFDVTKTLQGPAQGAFEVRFANDTTVFATLDAVGVGDVYMVGGQSNHVGGGNGEYIPAVAPAAHPTWKATEYAKDGTWRENVETPALPFSSISNATYAVEGTGNAYNSYFGKLATLFMAAGRPVAFVPCALGSTAIASWAPSTSTSTLYGAMLARAQEVGAHKALLWWQGEADALAGNPQAGHETALSALVSDWYTRTGNKTVLMNINSAGTGSGYTAIHAAIANVAATSPYVASIADMNGAFAGLHYAASSEIDTVASRAYSAITTGNYASPDTQAPTLSSPAASKTGSTTASWSVSTDEGSGTLYVYFSTNASETVAAIKSSGAQVAVTTAGVQSGSKSGLTPATTYYAHFAHSDAAGNTAAEETKSASFMTDAAPSGVTPVSVNAGSIPAARKVIFAGGTRTVVF